MMVIMMMIMMAMVIVDDVAKANVGVKMYAVGLSARRRTRIQKMRAHAHELYHIFDIAGWAISHSLFVCRIPHLFMQYGSTTHISTRYVFLTPNSSA